MQSHPSTIGRYQVERLLGAGGMGAVYLARDPAIGRKVAVKVLRTDDEEYRRRFKLEVTAAGALRHRNISMLFDSGEHDGSPFLAMEYIPGETLAEKIKQHAPLSLDDRLRYIEELCDGLAHAHKAGIVHRDIKPANVIVDGDNDSVKIVDFGIARLADSINTQSGLMMGTLSYMSPEQVMGKRVDHRSDIFAVGLVLYELLSYKRAFPGGLDDGLMYRILHEEPDDLSAEVPGLPSDISAIVYRALRKDPAERFATITSMSAALKAARRRLTAETEIAPIGPPRSVEPPPPMPPPRPVEPPPLRPPEPLPPRARPLAKAPDPRPVVPRPDPVPVAEHPEPVFSFENPAAAPDVRLARSRLWVGGAVAIAVLVVIGLWPDSRPPSGPAAGSPPATTSPASGPSPQRQGSPGTAQPQPPATGGSGSAIPPTAAPPAPDRTPAVAETRLRITAPADAVAMLDGRRVSLLSSVSPGEHTLSISLPGHFGTSEQRVRVAPGETHAVRPNLSAGTIVTGSLPYPYESVRVNGQPVGTRARALPTKFTAEFLPQQGSAMSRRTATFDVAAGAEVDLATLVPQGSFRFEVTPAAQVTLDLRAFGNGTGAALARIAAGDYPLRIARPGYPDFTSRVQVRAGQETLVRYAYNFATATWVVR